MMSGKEVSKECLIKKEVTRLRKIFDDLDYNKLQAVESLITNLAFISVSLVELQEIINQEGYVEDYRNSVGTLSRRQTEAVKVHISMTKNHMALIKQLVEIVPAAKKKESRLQALRDE